ncbi:two component system sensor kinase SsrB [Slackia heliotrinireducens]|uniref:Response regulator containing a CheY-like receiver domain and an HTH DNA-binding domain n=1 Tax=Slackia heliotrinireducens (strain ATCC 29202 / DSM 20476 / NCTC 11029 / RHS 1) TaxID=471855 RepID=C7N3S8_SLAHD|nr:helix-turn-helix transcriptional regulator [Slackia heliotrinireducens]ACV21669.1 response regulator containing a CheY-like receiver domain and an HTH DNA-binding domain [Slackia heliotrinireducens DSM 20476]VEG99279.1 two component system sensor kinase SsrB [Slackia heliotrinireducens]
MAEVEAQKAFSEAYAKARSMDEAALSHPSMDKDPVTWTEVIRSFHFKRLKEDAGLVGALGFGCIQAWLFLSCFAPSRFMGSIWVGEYSAMRQLMTFACYLLTSCLFAEVITARKPMVQASVLTIAAALASLSLSGSLFAGAGSEVIGALANVKCILSGSAMGYCLALWARHYAATGNHETLRIGEGLMTSVLVVAVCLLGSRFGIVSSVVLPLVTLGCLHWGLRLSRNAAKPPVQEKPASKNDVPMPPLPWRLMLGLIALGLGYGLCLGYSESTGSYPPSIVSVCLAVNALVGGILVVYAVQTGSNFGYSDACAVVLPLAVFGQCWISTFQNELLPVAAAAMRAAFLLFDCLLWLQLPKVYERTGTLKVFFLLRFCLEGSIFLGLSLRVLTFASTDILFKVVSVTACAMLLSALMLTFANNEVSNVWGFMPVPVMVGGRFSKACQQVKGDYGLTAREYEVMQLVMRGRNGTFIQDKLVISQSTFQTHMRNLYRKLDIHSNQELIDLLEEYIQKVDDRQ